MFDSKGAKAVAHGVKNTNRVITEEFGSLKASIQGSWVCKAHESHRHDFFLSYRVSSEKELANALYIELNKRKRSDGKTIRAFLDAFCLRDGENWQDGFLHGVAQSRVIVLLISEASLVNIMNANQRQDNVLLEYEHALATLAKGGWDNTRIMPVFVGHHEIVTRSTGATVRAYLKLAIPSIDSFPDEPHKTTNSPEGYTKTVRETMRSVLALQGHFINPEERLDDLYHDLIHLLNN